VGYLSKGAVCWLLAASAAGTAELKPRTIQAFDDYIVRVEARVDQLTKSAGFLWSREAPDRLRQVRDGQILAESVTGGNPMEVPDGLIHDWIGAVFIPGVSLDKVLRLVEDYDHHKDVYQPEVIGSRLVSRDGNDYKVYLRLLKKKVITVVLDTRYDVRYVPVDSTRWYARSYSTSIQEVDNAGKPGERDLPAGKDHGFLWRLNSYWRYAQADGGVYMEC
jgi:hypothetical protein